MAPTSTPIGALAGQDASPQTAPPTDAGAGFQQGDVLAAPPSFSQQVGQGANDLAEQQTPQQASKPGAWARTLVGAVQGALSGFGAGGKVPPGAGALYGVGAAARQAQARTDQQRQQATENQQKTQQMTREQAIAAATIAHENASTAQEQMLTSQLSQSYREKNIAMGTAALGPYVKAGAGVIQQDVDSDEVQALIQQKKLNPTQQHAFATGQKPVLDANGKPQLDSSGNPMFRPTYTVVGDVPQVELDDANSKLISENTPYKLPVGSKMSGLVYGTLVAQAQAAQTATASIDEARNEAGLKALETNEKLGAMKMLPDWSSALSKSGNNPFAALQYMESNPAMKQKYPDVANQVQSLYGGPKEWESMRHDRVEEQQKAIEDAQKKLDSKNATWGDPSAKSADEFRGSLTPEQQSAVDLVGQGRAPLNNPGYLLARNTAFVEAVSKLYPEVDLSKVGAYQSAYKDFTSGKDADQLQAGAVAMQHLNQLKQLNTLKSRIPGTADNKAYENLLDTVSSELGRFYDNNTIPAIAGYRKTLGGLLNRNAAIDEQANAMGVRMDSYDDKWSSAAPSKEYEAKMPGTYAAARQARANLDPTYKDRITPSPAATPQPPGPPAAGMKWQHSPSTGQFRQVPINGQ
jgi:hypothetical protein